MPADTVQLAGQRINRKALYIAGAVAVGVVGYAWMTRKPQVPPEVVTESELDRMSDERVPTTGVPYNPNIGGPSTGITDNAQWAQFATDRLNQLGYDPISVGDALGKFLDRKPLTPAEANIARAAIAQAGEPPIGRPWPVLTESPVASVGLLAPTGLSAEPQSGGAFIVRWNPVQGAVRYRVAATEPGADSASGQPAWEESTFHAGNPWPERAGKPTTYHVQGQSAAGQLGPAGSITFTIPGSAAPAPAPAPTPGPAPSPPGQVPWMRAYGYRDAVLLEWGAAEGAQWYEFVRIAGNNIDTPWTNVGNKTQVAWPQDVAEDSHYAYAVRPGNQAGYGPPTMSNDTWILK